MSCEMCTDPDGVACFPMYGLGPHTHTPNGIVFHENIELSGYTPDPDEFGYGWYWCPMCGSGKPTKMVEVAGGCDEQ